MKTPRDATDLVILVADKNMEAGVAGILSRPQALGIRPVTFQTYVHPARDPGCRSSGHDFLRSMAGRYQYALVMFDREGSGKENLTREQLERNLEEQLREMWGERAAVVCLDPELEVWVWSNSPQIASALGWGNRWDELREWLGARGVWADGEAKPSKPKDAVEAALKEARKPRSSSVYSEVASAVSIQRCTDEAFAKFRKILQTWFPPLE